MGGGRSASPKKKAVEIPTYRKELVRAQFPLKEWEEVEGIGLQAVSLSRQNWKRRAFPDCRLLLARLLFSHLLSSRPYSGPLETCTRIHEEATEAKPEKPEKPKRYRSNCLTPGLLHPWGCLAGASSSEPVWSFLINFCFPSSSSWLCTCPGLRCGATTNTHIFSGVGDLGLG